MRSTRRCAAIQIGGVWVVLVDGQRDQIKRVERTARKVGVRSTSCSGIGHALEYLWRAAVSVRSTAAGSPT